MDLTTNNFHGGSLTIDIACHLFSCDENPWAQPSDVGHFPVRIM